MFKCTVGTKDVDWWVTQQLISSSVVGVGDLIDGSQNAVWPLVLEDEFRKIMKIAVSALRRLWNRRRISYSFSLQFQSVDLIYL